MQLDRPLISVLDTGETASLVPRGADPHESTFTSDDPAIVAVTPEGMARGVFPGTTTLHLRRGDGGQRALPVTVLAPQSQPVSFLAGHPRLRFTTDELAARRALLAGEDVAGLKFDLGAAKAGFLARADLFATEPSLEILFEISGETFPLSLPHPLAQPEPLPQPYGFTDYPFWTRLSREIEQQLVTLSLAWSLTGEERYAAKATQILLALANWQKWHEYDKATNNLSLPHFTMGAAIAYDELHDRLSPDEQATVQEAILELGLRPMSYWFHDRLDHNIVVLMNAGMLLGALAIGDDTPYLDKYVTEPLDALRWYLTQREESGTTEGLVYTSYACGTIFKAGSAARRVTGDDTLLRSPFMRETLPDLYLYLRGGAGGFANLSDARYLESDPGALMLQHYNEYEDRRAAWLVQRSSVDGAALFPHLQRDLPSPSAAALDFPRSRRFTPFDWAALRTGFGDDDTLVAFTSSPSAVGHNHFDQNHFILNTGGDWLICDPGYQNYTPGPEHVFTNATIGHNALLVNDEGQLTRGHGRIIAAELGEDIDLVTGDATAAYEGRLERWHRHVLFAKPDYVLIVDDIIPAAVADRLTLLFHTTHAVTANGTPLAVGATIDDARGTSFAIAGPHASVRLRTGAGSPIQIRHDHYPGAERFGSYLRAELTPADRHLVATVLHPTLGGPTDDLGAFAFHGDASGARLEIAHAAGHDVVRIDRAPGGGPLVTSLIQRARSQPATAPVK